MTRKVVLIDICRGVIWKETAKALKLLRMKSTLEDYKNKSFVIIELHRKIESQIIYYGKTYTRFEYRKMIDDLSKE